MGISNFNHNLINDCITLGFNDIFFEDIGWTQCVPDDPDCVDIPLEDQFIPYNYEFNATLSAATVTIDGVAQSTGKLAAFVGDEMRGLDSDGAFDMDPFGSFYEMDLGANDSGETMTFKFYDDVNDVVIDLNETYDFEANEFGFVNKQAKKDNEILSLFEKQRSLWRDAVRRGIKVAMGSDQSHRLMTGNNLVELEYMVDWLGLSPMEAIVCATGRAAECMQRTDVGALEPGRLADVVVVEGDPLSDIKLLQGRDKIKLIMKNGEFYKQKLVE